MSSENPLEVWRNQRGLSKPAAALALNVSLGQFYAWLNGDHIPHESKAHAIYLETGVTRSQLMAWKEKRALPVTEQVAL